jgi:hypothetical protein
MISTFLRRMLGDETTVSPLRARMKQREQDIRNDPDRRAPAREQDKTLAPETLRWMRALPNHRRPLSLAAAYPRICNKLALIWADNLLTEYYFNGLLLDTRGGRKGFAPKIAAELISLHEFHVRNLSSPEAVKAWDDRMLAVGDR